VLVVDDDPVACEHAKLVLETVGIAVEVVESGAEAVDMVRVRRARRNPYDLILVDWKMPDMDGVETTRQIRSIAGDESAIIILTAYNWDDVLEEAVEAGVDSFIAKPLFANNVIEEFQRAFNKRNANAKDQQRADLTGRRMLLAEDVEVLGGLARIVYVACKVIGSHAHGAQPALVKAEEHAQVSACRASTHEQTSLPLACIGGKVISHPRAGCGAVFDKLWVLGVGVHTVVNGDRGDALTCQGLIHGMISLAAAVLYSAAVKINKNVPKLAVGQIDVQQGLVIGSVLYSLKLAHLCLSFLFGEIIIPSVGYIVNNQTA
jgi:CheY-like chemotaxis protein